MEAYKSATGWSAFASRIYPLSIYEAGGLANLITFVAPAVEAIVLANFDNGDGYFMKSEAAAVTNIGTLLGYNENIITLHELKYFTGYRTGWIDHIFRNGSSNRLWSIC